MRKITPFLAALLLSGCAHDQYAVTDDSNANPALLGSELGKCKQEALDAYFHARYTGSHGNAVILGGILGGAVGGALMGASTPTTFPASEIDPYIERCMAAKGYTGHSEN